MRTTGQLAPVVVRPGPGGRYTVIAGHRRADAHARLVAEGRTSDRDPSSQCGPELRAVVVEVGDVEALRIAIVENSQRADLCALERSLEVGHVEARLTAVMAARRRIATSPRSSAGPSARRTSGATSRGP
jgi:ParB-like chromosome segregation protein Spo0J